LEEQAGSLFIRERRTLRLTPNGERLLGKIRQLLAINDDLWADMTGELINGRVRLGAPYDLAGTWLPSILKTFSDAHPKVEIELICLASPELQSAIINGTIDLALVEEPMAQSNRECLAIDRLVWVGAKGGTAHFKSPLPVSMVAETCAFRPIVLDALANSNLTWRTLFESGSIDATRATIQADLAVTVWLESTVPNDLDILNFDDKLPMLPSFAINLYRAKGQLQPAANELAKLILQTVNHTVKQGKFA
jgi:DNA-binding transcriptional LysR family regulator